MIVILKKYWLKLGVDTRVNLTIGICTWCIVSFVVGATNSRMDSPRHVCEYESVISRINPPYILGCELFGARFRE